MAASGRQPPRDSGESTTRESLLDAGEELFGEHGYAATSLRQLTTAAGANLAAVNYHFGGKEGLAKAVLARRIEPINQERLRRLDALRGRRVTAKAVLRAFIEPPLRAEGCAVNAPGPSPAKKLCRVFGRINAEQPPFLRDFLATQFGEGARRFAAELGRSAPTLTTETIWWRLHFVIGAMAHTLQNAPTLARLSDGRCDPDDVDQMIEELVAFAAGGLGATAPKTTKART